MVQRVHTVTNRGEWPISAENCALYVEKCRKLAENMGSELRVFFNYDPLFGKISTRRTRARGRNFILYMSTPGPPASMLGIAHSGRRAILVLSNIEIGGRGVFSGISGPEALPTGPPGMS